MYNLPIEADALMGKPYSREEKAEISFNHNTLVTQSDAIKPKPFIDSNPYLSNKTLSIKSTRVFHIRARSRQPIAIEVTNKDLQEGYLPRVSTQKGVYIGESLVTQTNGVCHVLAINTLSEDVEINIEAQELEPFSYRKRRRRLRPGIRFGSRTPSRPVLCRDSGFQSISSRSDN